MRKSFIKLFIIICIGLCSIKSFSQNQKTIEFRDLIDNGFVEINIQEDWNSQNIILTSKTKNVCDIVKVNNVQEIDTIYLVMERFLVVKYRVRGGSGEHLRYAKIFTLKEGNIYESLSLLIRHDSFSSNGDLQREYKLIFTINKLNEFYSLSLTEEEKKLGKPILSKTIRLNFDLDYMIFYTNKIKTGKTICIENKLIKSNCVFFKVDLRKQSFIFNKKMWYQEDEKGCFYRM